MNKMPKTDRENTRRGQLQLGPLLSAGFGVGLILLLAFPRLAVPNGDVPPFLGSPLQTEANAKTVGASSASTPPDPERLRLGQQLFRLGLGWELRPLEGQVAEGTVTLSGEAVACLRCHGSEGEGQAEGGILAPSLQKSMLSQAVLLGNPEGRPARPPYDRALLLRAIEQGLDSGGRPLQGVMPRFSLLPQEREALLSVLETLGQGAPEHTHVLKVGIVPPSADEAGPLPRLRAELEQRLKQTPPIFGREVELDWVLSEEVSSAELGPPARWREQPPLVVVSLRAELSPAWQDWLEQTGVPLLGSWVEGCSSRPLLQQRCFQLLPSLRVQGLLAVERLAQRSPQGTWEVPPVLVVATEGRGQAWLEGVEAGMARLEQPPPWVVRWQTPEPLTPVLAEVMRRQPQWILFEGELEGLRTLTTTLAGHERAQKRTLGIFWAGTGPEGATVRGPFALPVVFHWTGREEVSRQARAELTAKVGLTLVLEALRGAGALVTPGRLVGALEQLRRFPVAEGEAVSFGARRHMAWRGGWLLGWKAASSDGVAAERMPPEPLAEWLEAAGE